jgi:hypothetical protein
MKIVVVPDLQCPRCGAVEVEDKTKPVREWVWNIRSNRVHTHGRWWSQCLLCVDKGGHKGWF